MTLREMWLVFFEAEEARRQSPTAIFKRATASSKMLPVAQWVLCLLQARAVGASWWAVLLMVLGIMCLEHVLPVRRQRAWPELFRATISLIITMQAFDS